MRGCVPPRHGSPSRRGIVWPFEDLDWGRARHTPPSSLRTQGPISTGLSCLTKAVCDRASRSAAAYGSRLALRLAGTTRKDCQVVPANAGTHTLRLILGHNGGRLSQNNYGRWLWAPAFAGAT